jgi:hypothetical protein
MVLSSFALGVLNTNRVSLLKPSVVAGLKGGGFFSFSKASERFESPVCFDGGGSSPSPSDETGLIDDGSLGVCCFVNDDGFSGEDPGAFSAVLLLEDEVGIAMEKAFL